MPLTAYSWPTSITPNVTTGEIVDTLAVYDRLAKIIGGWGARGPVVAASGSPQALQNTADFVCDGTADQVEIDLALDTGRPVLLLPGDFNFSASLTYADTNSKLLKGCGRGPGVTATRINLANAVNDYAIKFPSIVEPGMRGFVLEDFSIYANGLNQTAGGGIDAKSAIECEFRRLHVNRPYDHGIRLDGKSDGFGHNNWIINLWADGSADSGGVAGVGQAVHIVGSDENHVLAGNFQSMGGRSATGSYATQDWVGLNTWDGITIVGGLVTATVFTGGLWIRDCNRVKVLNWTFDGVPGDNLFATGDSHIISGCHVMGPGNATSPRSGLVFDNNTALCQVYGNILESSQTNGWTRSLIRETGAGTAPNNSYGPNTFRVHPGVTLTGAKVERASGSTSLLVDSVGLRTESFVRKTANESVTSSVTLQNDDHLVLAVEANTVYELTGLIIYDGATTGDIKLGWTVPAAATFDWSPQGPGTAATSATTNTKQGHDTATDSESLGAAGTGAGNRLVARVVGLLQVAGTAGNLQLQWAQSVSDVTATTVLANSYLRLRRVA